MHPFFCPHTLAAILGLFFVAKQKGKGSKNLYSNRQIIPGLKIEILDQGKFEEAKRLTEERIEQLKRLNLKSFTPAKSGAKRTRDGYDLNKFQTLNPEIVFISDLTLVNKSTSFAKRLLNTWLGNNSFFTSNTLFDQLTQFQNQLHPQQNRKIKIPQILSIVGGDWISYQKNLPFNELYSTTVSENDELNFSGKQVGQIERITAPTDLLHLLIYYQVPFVVSPEAAEPLNLWHYQQ